MTVWGAGKQRRRLGVQVKAPGARHAAEQQQGPEEHGWAGEEAVSTGQASKRVSQPARPLARLGLLPPSRPERECSGVSPTLPSLLARE